MVGSTDLRVSRLARLLTWQLSAASMCVVALDTTSIETRSAVELTHAAQVSKYGLVTTVLSLLSTRLLSLGVVGPPLAFETTGLVVLEAVLVFALAFPFRTTVSSPSSSPSSVLGCPGPCALFLVRRLRDVEPGAGVFEACRARRERVEAEPFVFVPVLVLELAGLYSCESLSGRLSLLAS
jgi:hypothetical protein